MREPTTIPMNELTELTDAELEAVSGGLVCNTLTRLASQLYADYRAVYGLFS
jgi:bacteriocin-like protein